LPAALFGLFPEHHGTHSTASTTIPTRDAQDTYSTVLDQTRVIAMTMR
jgi:hypothetical protein